MPGSRPLASAILLLCCVGFSPALDRPKVTGANWPLAQKFTREFVAQHVQEASIAPVVIQAALAVAVFAHGSLPLMTAAG